MALQDIQPVITPPKKGGGGLGGALGTIGGAVVGGALGSLTANPGGIMAGASLGAGLGSQAGAMAGEAIDPSQGGSASGGVPQIQNRSEPLKTVAANNPEIGLAQMQASKSLLKQSNLPDAEKYMAMIDEASNKMKSRLGVTV